MKYILLLISSVLSACVGVTQPIKFQSTDVVTKSVYAQSKASNGVVLMDINWGRRWGCGGRENAQLISLAFDHLPTKSLVNGAAPSLVIHSPSRLMVDPVFNNYAYSFWIALMDRHYGDIIQKVNRTLKRNSMNIAAAFLFWI